MTTPLRTIRQRASGAALIIVLAFVALLTVLVVAYFTRTTTDRQLAKTSFTNTSADLLARSALDIIVGDFKQEIATANASGTPGANNIQPQRYGIPAPVNGGAAIPNLIRRSASGDPTGRTSNVNSENPASANGRAITTARWNNHYLIPRGTTSPTVDSSPIPSFVAPDWVLITAQGPNPAPAPGDVIGRFAYAVYDEGGLLDLNVAGFPTYASLGLGPGSFIAKATPELGEIMRASYSIPASGKEKTEQPTTASPGGLSLTLVKANASKIISPPIAVGKVGAQFFYQLTASNDATSYNAAGLPPGLSLDRATGLISGTPSATGTYTVTASANNTVGGGLRARITFAIVE
jgi:Tfp pilus assembly protein PilX